MLTAASNILIQYNKVSYRIITKHFNKKKNYLMGVDLNTTRHPVNI